MIVITLPDGSQKSFDAGSTPVDVAKSISVMDRATKKLIAEFLFLMMNLLFFCWAHVKSPAASGKVSSTVRISVDVKYAVQERESGRVLQLRTQSKP